MKKRVLRQALFVLVAFTIICGQLPPVTAEAATTFAPGLTDTAVAVGTGSTLRASTTEICLAGQRWYVVGLGTAGINKGSGTVTLLLKDPVSQSIFSPDDKNVYNGSSLQAAVNALLNGQDAREQAALVGLTLGEVAGTQPTDQKVWALSTSEAQTLSTDVRTGQGWWLRSVTGVYNPVYVMPDGVLSTTFGAPAGTTYGVRAGTTVNLSRVAFAAPLVGAKGTTLGAMTAVSPSNALKFTLLDSDTSNLNLAITGAPGSVTKAQGSTLSLPFSGAKTGPDKSVACVLVSNTDGLVKYYAKLNTAESGTLEIPFTSAVQAGSYSLLVFNEQICSGDHSDYASTPIVVGVTVTAAGANHAPQLQSGVGSTSAASVAVGSPYTKDLSTLFTDPDGNALSYKVSINSAAAIPAERAFSYTPQVAGTTTLRFTASDGALDSPSHTVTLTANAVRVTGITVHTDNYATSIGRNGQVQLVYEVTPANATNKVVNWTCTVNKAACGSYARGEIDAANILRMYSMDGDGTIELVAAATDGSGVTGKLTLQSLEHLVSSIEVSTIDTDYRMGKPVQLQATVNPWDASVKTIAWSITAGGDKATVSATGVLSPTWPGSVTVRATAQDGSAIYGEKTLFIKSVPGAPSAPTSSAIGPDYVTLNEIAGAEYSRDGVNWQDSLIFGGLSPNTHYSFYARIKATSTATESLASAALTVTTAKATLGGTVAISGVEKFDETLTANISGLVYTPHTTGTPTYLWRRAGVPIPGATGFTYELVAADIGQTISVTVTADGINATGSVDSSPTAMIGKAVALPPAAPALASKTHNTVTLVADAACEFKLGVGEWQSSNEFSGLSSETAYSFYARLKATATHLLSAESVALEVTTDPDPLPALTGSVSIGGSLRYNQVLTADISALTYSFGTGEDNVLSYQWKRGSASITDATQPSYTLVEADIGQQISVVVTADGVHARGSLTGTTLTLVQKAEAAAPDAPTLAALEADSVQLNAIAGAEYSRDQANWQDEVTFGSLAPNTPYSFYARMKETDTVSASAASAALTVTTEQATLTGTVSISGNLKFGQTLEAVITGLIYTPAPATPDVPTYQWKRAGEDITGAIGSTYTLVQADIGKHISVIVTASGVDAIGSVPSTETAEVEKADATAPALLTLDSKTHDTVTLGQIDGGEYSQDGSTWQASPVFSGLTPKTSYTFFVRLQETATHLASPDTSLTVTTAPAPMSGTVTITGTLQFGCTLSVDTDSLSPGASDGNVFSYQWKRDSDSIPGAESPTYTLAVDDIGKTITVIVSADGVNASGSASDTTTTVEKADMWTPAMLEINYVDYRSITLKPFGGLEYSNGGSVWQDSNVFTDLNSETEYSFYARYKETATHKTSEMSPVRAVTTREKPAIGGTVGISGIGASGIPQYGQGLTANLGGLTYSYGAGEDNVLSYQWTRDLESIEGANTNSYTVVEADIGHALNVVVTADGVHAVGSVPSTYSVEVEKADVSAPSILDLGSKDYRSVTLTPVAGVEYSNGGTVWQDGNVFSGLDANTVYSFYARYKETATHTASPVSPVLTVTTEPKPLMAGAVVIDGTLQYGELLEAKPSLTYSAGLGEDNVLSYQWTRDGLDISEDANDVTYTLALADIDHVIGVTVSADGVHATGTVTGTATARVAKADADAPAVLELFHKTHDAVTLIPITGAEYSRDGSTWQESAEFIGLTPKTAYTFYGRLQETTTHKASTDVMLNVTTDPTPMVGTVTISGTFRYGQTLNADTGSLTPGIADGNVFGYQWRRDGEDIGGATASSYTLAEADIGKQISLTVNADGVNAKGSVTSPATAAIAKANDVFAPVAPELLSKTYHSVTLREITGEEYSKDGSTWQSSNIFAGLADEQAYSFYARVRETNTHLASPASAALAVTTERAPIVDPPLQKTVVTDHVQTADDARLDEVLRETEVPRLTLSGSQATLGSGALTALSASNLPLTLVGEEIELEFPPAWVDLTTQTSTAIEIIAAPLTEGEQAEQLANAELEGSSGVFAVCGKVFSLTAIAHHGDATEQIHQFDQPVAVTVDLWELGELTDDEIAKLTAVRWEVDGAGNPVPVSLGGTYDRQTRKLTFYTDRFSLYGVAFLEQPQPRRTVTLTVGSQSLLVNGEARQTDVAPLLSGGRTLVPLRLIAEAMGADVQWLAASKTVVVEMDGRRVELVIGQIDSASGLDVAAQLTDGRTIVPLRYIMEMLGAQVSWVGASKQVQISK